MSLLWRKALGDARARPVQLGVIVLVLALGTAAMLAATDARTILERGIETSYARARSPDLTLWFDRVPADAITAAASFDGVAGVEARRVIAARVVAARGEWLPLRVTVLPDVGAQQVGHIHRHAPDAGLDAHRDGLWVEQSGRSLLSTDGELRVRMPNGATVPMPFAGFVHDPAVAPSNQERMIYAYSTPGSAARLGVTVDPDQLLVRLKQRGDVAYARDLGEHLRDRLVESGMRVLRVEPLATTHPHALLMNAVLRVLAVVSAMSFACTGALAAHLTASWMRRETKVIGILRSMGARVHQVVLGYLPLMLFVALAVGLAGVYAGGALARALAGFNAAVLNVDIIDWSAGRTRYDSTLWALFVVIVFGVGWPTLRACIMPVSEALADPGITPLTTGQRLGRALRVPGRVSQTYALRNALRRPWRLAVVAVALTIGGALFLAAENNYDSLVGVIDHALATQGHDIEVVLANPAAAAELESVAQSVPAVAHAEAWRRAAVRVGSPASEQPLIDTSALVALNGYPSGSLLFTLPLVAGRAPGANARDEVVVTRMVQDLRPDVRVGRVVTLDFRGRRSAVHVVGVVDQIATSALYAPFPVFEAVTALDTANALRVKVAGPDVGPVGDALDRRLLDAGMPAAQLIGRTLIRDAFTEHFSVVGSVLRTIALAAALLGALILGGGASFDVFERRREIGVLRSLGATRGTIARSFLIEGSIVLGVSALLAVGLSLALTSLSLDAAARTLLHVAVPMRLSLTGLAVFCSGALVAGAAVWTAVSLTLRDSICDATRLER